MSAADRFELYARVHFWRDLTAREADEEAERMGLKRRYRCIVADPPWRYERAALWSRPNVEDHYRTMTTADICALPVADLVDPDGCHLWLWTTNAHLLSGEAVQVVEAWGFRPRKLVTWCKPQLGLGSPLRSSSEFVVFATCGPLPRTRSRIGTWFIADRGAHSEKPHDFYRIVEQISPAPRLDIFARTHRSGWDVLGDEITPDLFGKPVKWPR